MLVAGVPCASPVLRNQCGFSHFILVTVLCRASTATKPVKSGAGHHTPPCSPRSAQSFGFRFRTTLPSPGRSSPACLGLPGLHYPGAATRLLLRIPFSAFRPECSTDLPSVALGMEDSWWQGRGCVNRVVNAGGRWWLGEASRRK